LGKVSIVGRRSPVGRGELWPFDLIPSEVEGRRARDEAASRRSLVGVDTQKL
jgi:hypothetical protein